MSKLKVGDKVIRQIDGFRGRVWEYPGIVTSLTPEAIICKVDVDVTRTMKFDPVTGVNEQGREYGWLKNFTPVSIATWAKG